MNPTIIISGIAGAAIVILFLVIISMAIGTVRNAVIDGIVAWLLARKKGPVVRPEEPLFRPMTPAEFAEHRTGGNPTAPSPVAPGPSPAPSTAIESAFSV